MVSELRVDFTRNGLIFVSIFYTLCGIVWIAFLYVYLFSCQSSCGFGLGKFFRLVKCFFGNASSSNM